jgi:hypothetical protein
LARVDEGAHVARVDLQDAAEGGERIFGAVLRAGDEAEDVLGLRGAGRERGGGLGLAPRLVRLGHVEEGDGEVDARESELRVEPERAAELLGPVRVAELFEQRDAEVVRAIRLLACACLARPVRSARAPLCAGAGRRAEGDEGQAEDDGGELARAYFHG